MRKRALAAFFVTLAAAGGLITLPSPWQGKAVAAGADVDKHFDLFSDVLEKVRANYVVQPDDSKLLEDAINGALTGFDQRRGTPIVLSPQRGNGAASAADSYKHFGDVLAELRANHAAEPDELETP